MSQPQRRTPVYDIENQLKRIQAYVIPGETLLAVYDCKGGGTGFVGITDRRLIFYDETFVTGKKAMVSIPYNQIIGVASADEGVVFQTSEITLMTAAGNYTFVFRGADKAHWAYAYIIDQLITRASPQLPG
jgi:PH (Pleckstrin Homology) domain-containing protein